jgi:hypothetical protein
MGLKIEMTMTMQSWDIQRGLDQWVDQRGN